MYVFNRLNTIYHLRDISTINFVLIYSTMLCFEILLFDGTSDDETSLERYVGKLIVPALLC